jgi:hypothetical protein
VQAWAISVARARAMRASRYSSKYFMAPDTAVAGETVARGKHGIGDPDHKGW